MPVIANAVRQSIKTHGVVAELLRYARNDTIFVFRSCFKNLECESLLSQRPSAVASKPYGTLYRRGRRRSVVCQSKLWHSRKAFEHCRSLPLRGKKSKEDFLNSFLDISEFSCHLKSISSKNSCHFCKALFGPVLFYNTFLRNSSTLFLAQYDDFVNFAYDPFCIISINHHMDVKRKIEDIGA
jgi:hypothetical protein